MGNHVRGIIVGKLIEMLEESEFSHVFRWSSKSDHIILKLHHFNEES